MFEIKKFPEYEFYELNIEQMLNIVHTFKITKESITNYNTLKISDNIIQELNSKIGTTFENHEKFREYLLTFLDEEQMVKFFHIILQYSRDKCFDRLY